MINSQQAELFGVFQTHTDMKISTIIHEDNNASIKNVKNIEEIITLPYFLSENEAPRLKNK